jgi:hypothetical protein
MYENIKVRPLKSRSMIIRESHDIIDREIKKMQLGWMLDMPDKVVARGFKDTVRIYDGLGNRIAQPEDIADILVEARRQHKLARLGIDKAIRRDKASRVTGDKNVRARREAGKWAKAKAARLGKIVLALENIRGNENENCSHSAVN